MSHGESVEAVLERLGASLLCHEAGPAGPDQVFDHVVVFDRYDDNPVPPRGLVLGVGVRGALDISLTLDRVLRARATVLVVRAPADLDDALRARAAATGVTILSLIRGATWVHVARLLQPPAHGGEDRWSAVGAADVELDLFTVANSLSALLDAPVTIEDLHSRILAFSADQERGDGARQASVLGRQVPGAHQARLTELGVFRDLYSSPRPIAIAPFAPDVAPRVAFRVAAGDEMLGSIWIICDEPLTLVQEQAVIETANVAAIAVLRNRIGADTVQRLRVATVSALLEGGQPAREAAARLRSSSSAVVGGHVVAVGLPDSSSSRPATSSAANLDHVASSLTMLLRSELPNTVAAVLGETTYAVVPAYRAGADLTPVIRRLAEGFTQRLGTDWRSLGVAIGVPVTKATDLHLSRVDADRVLRALHAHSGDRGRTPAVATRADVATQSLLLRLSDLIEGDVPGPATPLDLLAEYDRAHDAALVATLRLWLDLFGDVAATSERLHVHKNTLRYRLKRIEDVTGVDLTDPERRFELMLQFRLDVTRT